MEVFESPNVELSDDGDDETKKVASGENIIVVESDYVVNSQGVLVSFYIPTNFVEISELVELSNMFIEFVKKDYKELLEEFDFDSKSTTPIVYSDEENKLKMVLCFCAEPSERLLSKLRGIGIKQTTYL